jgi:hypothetical protein
MKSIVLTLNPRIYSNWVGGDSFVTHASINKGTRKPDEPVFCCIVWAFNSIDPNPGTL